MIYRIDRLLWPEWLFSFEKCRLELTASLSWIQLKLYHSSSNHIYRFILRRNHCCLFTIIFLVCPSFKSSNVKCMQTFSHIGSDTLLTCNWIISLAMLAKHAFLCFYTCKWQFWLDSDQLLSSLIVT